MKYNPKGGETSNFLVIYQIGNLLVSGCSGAFLCVLEHSGGELVVTSDGGRPTRFRPVELGYRISRVKKISLL